MSLQWLMSSVVPFGQWRSASLVARTERKLDGSGRRAGERGPSAENLEAQKEQEFSPMVHSIACSWLVTSSTH